MKTTVIPAVVLGLLVIVWMYVTAILGFHRHPSLEHVFVPVVMVIHISVLVWALRAAGRQGATYGALVRQGTLISVLTVAFVIAGSVSLTALAFPTFYEDSRALHEKSWRDAGLPAAEIAARLDFEKSMGKPWIGALIGAFMTVLTGFVASLIIALFTRRRPAKA